MHERRLARAVTTAETAAVAALETKGGRAEEDLGTLLFILIVALGMISLVGRAEQELAGNLGRLGRGSDELETGNENATSKRRTGRRVGGFVGGRAKVGELGGWEARAIVLANDLAERSNGHVDDAVGFRAQPQEIKTTLGHSPI